MWQDIESVLLGDHFAHQTDPIAPKATVVVVPHPQSISQTQSHRNSMQSLPNTTDLISLTTVDQSQTHPNPTQHETQNMTSDPTFNNNTTRESDSRYEDMTLDLTDFMLSADTSAQLYNSDTTSAISAGH